MEDSKVKQTLREQWQTDLIPTSQAGWNWTQAVVSRSPFKDRLLSRVLQGPHPFPSGELESRR